LAKIKTYSQANDYLLSKLPMFSRIGAAALKPNLDNITQLCNQLGNPQNNYKIIHIAGTNGKGTVSHLTAAMLISQGYKVGLHVSPHYRDLRERFKVDGKLAPKRFVIDFINSHSTVIEQIQPSFFEITVAMSFEYFKLCKVDYAVIEVGLGGRLDSTNIVKPILSVITNISYDHTDLLGNTLTQIAGEKAGIIKKEVPVIIGEYQSEVAEVFIAKANELDCQITFAEDVVQVGISEKDNFKTSVKGSIESVANLNFIIDLAGPFQDKNLITSLAILEFLYKKGVVKDIEKLLYKLKHFSITVNYKGRWQVLGKNPLIIADSAHNEAGLTHIIQRLKTMKKNKLHMVIGFVKDKKRVEILPKMPKDANYYFVQAQIPRALSAVDLQLEAKEFQLNGAFYPSVDEGLKAAKSNANKGDLIFVGGSIFVVAEVL
jgi:dihydrofolate synthase / folylpolyglutamate synthase